MPDWLFEKKELRSSPSSRDGIDYETECRYRKEGSRFIIDIGTELNLKHDTVATGCVYFHRFFMFHSFKDFNRYVAALGCLFLAGKVEETPKKCRDIIRAARQRLNDEQFAAFGEDPREELMTVERVLLQTIKFDLQVDHPYQYLLKYAKILKGDSEKIQKMVQMAWTFINDSFCTTLCLQWEPEIIAIALMYLASRLSKCSIEDWQGRNSLKANSKWWDQFVEDMSMDLLEEICHQVLDLYSNTGGKEKSRSNQHPATAANQQGRPPGASSASTPSPNAPTKTPTATTPNPVVTAPNFPAPSTPAIKAIGHSHQTPGSAPSTPAVMPQLMPLPPPLPPSIGQEPPAYAYAVPFAALAPPGTGSSQPTMPYAPTGTVYATYNYTVPPPTTAGAASSTMPASYAVPTGYGHQTHFDYRAGHVASGPQQPTYGAPLSTSHAYSMGLTVPPPSHHGPNMSQPPPGYSAAPPPPPPPPPHRSLNPHHHRRV